MKFRRGFLLKMQNKSKIPVFHISMFTSLRLVFNTAVRMVYPFIPFFSSGMKVDITAVTLAISLSMAISVAGPFIAPIADRHGRRSGMLVGLGIFTIGNALAALFPSYWTFLIALLLSNLGDNVFLPAMQAYLSDRTPYKRRGFVLGITELSWALSFILAIPLVGLLLKATFWYVPFTVLAGFGVLGIGLVLWKVERDGRHSLEGEHIYAGFRKLFTRRSAMFMLLAGLTMIIANEVVNVVFSVWMKDSFQVDISTLGIASLIIGISELGGEGLTTALVDRVGKERSVYFGLIANCLVVAALPFLRSSQAGALVWLFLFYLTFEYAVTASWPLASEVMPLARATMLSMFIAALSLGRAVGALIGPLIYRLGFMVDAIVCVVFNIACMLLLMQVRVRVENKPQTNPDPS
jgi:predicted MFS family arabinose efflux permease